MDVIEVDANARVARARMLFGYARYLTCVSKSSIWCESIEFNLALEVDEQTHNEM